MYIIRGELYLEKSHIKFLKKEPEYVKQRYHSVATVLSSNGEDYQTFPERGNTWPSA